MDHRRRLTARSEDVTDRRRLDQRLRAEWIAGAEEEWRKRIGRPMTADELERVLRLVPGGRVGGSPIIVAIPIAIVAFVVADDRLRLVPPEPQGRMADRMDRWWLVLWSVATIAVVPNTHPTLCSILLSM